MSHDKTDPKVDEPASAPPPAKPAPTEDDELDLDLEEADDGDRLKEGFTGQER